jgi:hypothetical protein
MIPLPLLIPLTDYTLPPVRYQGDNTVVVTFAKPELVQELCGRHGVPELIGCANLLPPSMVVPNPCAFPEQSYARTLCHELGHANSWSYKHEDSQ